MRNNIVIFVQLFGRTSHWGRFFYLVDIDKRMSHSGFVYMMNKIVSEIIKFLYNFANFVAFIPNSWYDIDTKKTLEKARG